MRKRQKSAKADGWSTEEEIDDEESPIRRGKDDRQSKAEWFSSGGALVELRRAACEKQVHWRGRGALVALMEVGMERAGECSENYR